MLNCYKEQIHKGDALTMAKECSFYFYDGDYCCALLKQRDRDYVVDSDWVHRFCWNYNHNECPYRQDSSGGCYLTSACIHAKNLPDDCYELSTLRNFRDTYVKADPNGETDIKNYYSVAPRIVERINLQTDSDKIWKNIYDELVLVCVHLIEEGKLQEAYEKYKMYTLILEKIWL